MTVTSTVVEATILHKSPKRGVRTPVTHAAFPERSHHSVLGLIVGHEHLAQLF